VLGALGIGQIERQAVQRLAGCRVVDDAFGVVATGQSAVPHPLWIEGDVGPEVALAEARIAQQACVWRVLQ